MATRAKSMNDVHLGLVIHADALICGCGENRGLDGKKKAEKKREGRGKKKVGQNKKSTVIETQKCSPYSRSPRNWPISALLFILTVILFHFSFSSSSSSAPSLPNHLFPSLLDFSASFLFLFFFVFFVFVSCLFFSLCFSLCFVEEKKNEIVHPRPLSRAGEREPPPLLPALANSFRIGKGPQGAFQGQRRPHPPA